MRGQCLVKVQSAWDPDHAEVSFVEAGRRCLRAASNRQHDAALVTVHRLPYILRRPKSRLAVRTSTAMCPTLGYDE